MKLDIPAKVIGVRKISPLKKSEQSELDQTIEFEKQKILEKFHSDAQSLLDNARKEAELIKKDIDKDQTAWYQEKQLLMEEAKKEGYQQGLHEGQSQGFDQYRDQIELAKKIVDDSKEEFLKHIESSEKVILDLGIQTAEKILQTTIADHSDKFYSLVKHVLKEAREYKEVHIHIHPSHFNYVMEHKDELDAFFANNQQCYIYPNDELEIHQCFIESGNGRIDASINSQLTELKKKLLEFLEGEHS